MKYILMNSGERLGSFKSLKKATEYAYNYQGKCSWDLDLTILEVFAEHEMRCSKDYYFKEKKF